MQRMTLKWGEGEGVLERTVLGQVTKLEYTQ